VRSAIVIGGDWAAWRPLACSPGPDCGLPSWKRRLILAARAAASRWPVNASTPVRSSLPSSVFGGSTYAAGMDQRTEGRANG
jgi:hypothetical protein